MKILNQIASTRSDHPTRALPLVPAEVIPKLMSPRTPLRRVLRSLALPLAALGLGHLVPCAQAQSQALPVTSGLQCWYDASVGVTGSGAGVTGWADQSGNGHTATKTAGTLTLVSGAINSLPAIQFSGNAVASMTGNMYSKTQFIVTKMNGGDWGAWMGSQVRAGYMYNQNGNCWDQNRPVAASMNGTATAANNFYLGDNRATQYQVLKIVGNDGNTSQRLYELGRQEGWSSLNNFMAELIAYNRVLTSTEENLVGGYLAKKYQVSTTYPTYPLMVSVTSPANNQAYPTNTSVTAVATVPSLSGSGPYSVQFHKKVGAGDFAAEGSPVTGAGPTFSLSLGALGNNTYQIYATVTDNVSATATADTNTFSVADPLTTTTALSATTASTYGQNATLTATVAAAATPNGGTVQFYDNSVALGSPVAINTSTGLASYTTNTLVVGTHPITATYSGYGIYLTSSTSGSMDQVVNQAVLNVTADNKVRSPGTGNPALTYQISGYQLGQTLATSGVSGTPSLACAAVPSDPVGNYPITVDASAMSAANYSFTGVAGNLKVVVGAPPTVTGANMACWYDAGQGVTTSGSNVTAWNDSSGNVHNASTAGGAVSYVASDTQIARPAVHLRSNGYMNCAGTFFAKEQYVVVRSPYSDHWGYGAFLGRASGRGSNVMMASDKPTFWNDQSPDAVVKNGTAVTRNQDPNGNYTYNVAPINVYMILKITVNNNNPTAAAYRIANADGNSLACDIAEIVGYDTALSSADEAKVGGYLAGKYGVSATYPPYYLTVKLNNPTLGQQFPYQTDVVAVAQVGEPNNTLTDTVTIYTKLLPDGPVVPHTTTQNGVLFTADLGSSLASGDYEMYATVTNNDSPTPGTATCATQTFTVALPTVTTTTLAATSPSTYGNSVTFTATVAPTPNGGSVQFYENDVALGSPVAVNTSTGQASISTSLLTVDGGTAHSITADYDGFGIYLSSSAAAVDQTVNPATLTVTANGKVRIPGTDNPPLTYMISGYKLTENAASAGVSGLPILACAANASSPEGSYEITCDPSPMSAPNYIFGVPGVSGYLNVMAGAVPVSNGLTCWYDAGSGVSTDGSGVTTWNDLSGNLHHATRNGTVTLGTNDVSSRPSVHLGRGGNSYLTCAPLNGMFTKEQYVVVRSGDGKTTWDGSGSFLGRAGGFLQVRTGSCNLYSGYTGFWDDVLPLAVSKNGAAVSSSRGYMDRGGFVLGTITDFMILKITVTQPDAVNIAAYPGYNIGKNETLGTASMDIAEIVGYDSALSAADEGALTAYLAAKYAIVVVPSAPTITAITPGAQSLSVAFTAPASDGGAAITNYKYSTNNGTTYTAVSPASTTSPIVISGLANGATYQVRILAVNVAGDGLASNSMAGTTLGIASAPTITGITPGDATLSVAFTAPGSDGGSAITNYMYSTNNGASFTAVSPPATTSPILISGLTNGTTYQVKILAVNSVGDGAASNSMPGTPAGSGGGYDTWASAQSPPLGGGAAAVGSDGIPNLVVYALKGLKTDGTNGSPGTLSGKTISFEKRPDAITSGDVSWAIETSTTLDSWTVRVTQPKGDATATISYDLSLLGDANIFARLVVSQ